MWWIIGGIPVGYLVIVRGTYGSLAWLGLLKEAAHSGRTAEENTRLFRLWHAWLWPIALLALVVFGAVRALSAFVTGGWHLPLNR